MEAQPQYDRKAAKKTIKRKNEHLPVLAFSSLSDK